MYHLVADNSIEQHLFNVSLLFCWVCARLTPSYIDQVQKKKASLARQLITLTLPLDKLACCIKERETFEGALDDSGDVNDCYNRGI